MIQKYIHIYLLLIHLFRQGIFRISIFRLPWVLVSTRCHSQVSVNI